MPSSPYYFLTEAGQRTGPHSLAVLKQKGELRAITADTLIAPESDPDGWSPLRDSPALCAELIPARVHYTLGAHAIKQINHPANPPAPSVEEILKSNHAREQTVPGNRPKPAAHASPLPTAPTVEDLLRGNLARAQAASGELMTPAPKRSRRRRFDYAFMVVFGNLFAVLAFVLLPGNPMVLVPLLGFVVIYNIGLAWVLFGVMDRY